MCESFFYENLYVNAISANFSLSQFFVQLIKLYSLIPIMKCKRWRRVKTESHDSRDEVYIQFNGFVYWKNNSISEPGYWYQNKCVKEIVWFCACLHNFWGVCQDVRHAFPGNVYKCFERFALTNKYSLNFNAMAECLHFMCENTYVDIIFAMQLPRTHFLFTYLLCSAVCIAGACTAPHIQSVALLYILWYVLGSQDFVDFYDNLVPILLYSFE